MIPKTFAEFKSRENARRALFWLLVGQAKTAFPDEFASIESGARIAGIDLGWDEGRYQAEIVEQCAKKFPKFAFTHL